MKDNIFNNIFKFNDLILIVSIVGLIIGGGLTLVNFTSIIDNINGSYVINFYFLVFLIIIIILALKMQKNIKKYAKKIKLLEDLSEINSKNLKIVSEDLDAKIKESQEKEKEILSLKEQIKGISKYDVRFWKRSNK